MDGSSHTIIHSSNLVDPRALTIDYQSQSLYWADYRQNILETSNTNGSNRIVLNSIMRNPYSMVFFNQTLYWTAQAYGQRGIYSAHISSPTNTTLILSTGNYPYGIQVFGENIQFEGMCILISVYVSLYSNFDLWSLLWE